MTKYLRLLALFMICSFGSQAQFSKYIVQFNNKADNPFSINNPSAFLSQRAIDRRTRTNISIDSTDLPVTPRYIDSIRLAGNVTILQVSKRLNQVSIQTTDAAALAKINSFSFVRNTAPIAARTTNTPVNKNMQTILADIPVSVDNSTQNGTDYYNYGKSNGQVKIHQGNFLHNHGFRGEGMQMAIMDAGFFNHDILPTFDSLRNNNQLLGTWDFVDNEASVSEDNSHGMHCLSTIGANIPGVFVGTAPKTSFYLYRTEDVSSEYPVEEHNLAVGAEVADSAGVDVCSISLGYYLFDNAIFNYTYNDMNGNSSISARAADLAAKKGMLMVIAAGNEGNGSWRYVITPGDADSVFAIGAVDTLGNVAGFSSYGPSSDGQIKPAVAAVGWNAIVANGFSGQPAYSSGTSFACPNMAGIATCLWQAFPESNNMLIIDALQRAATQANNPDDRKGYGIPDAKKAFVILQKRFSTLQSSFADCKANLSLSIKTDPTMSIDIERKMAGESDYTLISNWQNADPFGQHTFNYVDDLANTSALSVQYRMVMHIGTDTTHYLDSVVVNYSASCVNIIPAENAILITPNPVGENLSVRISRTTASQVDIVLLNAAGQVIHRNNYQQQPGVTIKQIPMQAYSKGVYFVRVFINNQPTTTKRIIKQ